MGHCEPLEPVEFCPSSRSPHTQLRGYCCRIRSIPSPHHTIMMKLTFFILALMKAVTKADLPLSAFVGTVEYDTKSQCNYRIEHKYKCKKWWGGWNHYTKYESDSSGTTGATYDSYFRSDIMKLHDALCDKYRAKETSFKVKATENYPTDMLWVRVRITSRANSGWPGLELKIDLNGLYLSETTNKSNYDEFKVIINHENNHSFKVELRRRGDLKKTLYFDSNGDCTNCVSSDFKGSHATNTASASFRKYTNKKSGYNWYTAPGNLRYENF